MHALVCQVDPEPVCKQVGRQNSHGPSRPLLLHSRLRGLVARVVADDLDRARRVVVGRVEDLLVDVRAGAVVVPEVEEAGLGRAATVVADVAILVVAVVIILGAGQVADVRVLPSAGVRKRRERTAKARVHLRSRG